MKKFFKRLRQRKPFRVYVWKTISAIILVVPSVIAIYEAQLPEYLLWLLVPLYWLFDAVIKRINVHKLNDYWVEKK